MGDHGHQNDDVELKGFPESADAGVIKSVKMDIRF